MIEKEILRSGLKYLNCFLPVYKPKGICCNKLLFVLKVDLHFVLNHHEINHPSFEVSYVRALEPFADGLLTFSLGRNYLRKRNFIYADYRYRAKLQFGVEREYDCIDGQVLSHCTTEHLTQELLQNTITDFIGSTEQEKAKFVEAPDSQPYVDEYMKETVSIYSRIQLPKITKEIHSQKYPLEVANRVAICADIKLVDYNRPYAILDIECKGSFNVRQFAADLAKKLHTKANVIEMTRLMEGPVNLGDMNVLHTNELNLEYYIHRLPSIIRAYSSYVDQLDENFESPARPHI